jgi:putative sporulation protein YyaC
LKNNNLAVASEDIYKGIKIKDLMNKEDIHMALNGLIPNCVTNNDIVFLCIGTDRSTGDSLAPHVGTYLKGLGYENVYGTIDDPVHALNSLPKNKVVIAIDACLGKLSSVGQVQAIKGSIKAGAGVGKDLPEAGDYGIYGIVNVKGFMEYFVLQNTRLSVVVKMAKDITSALVERFPIEEIKSEREIKFVSKEKDKNVVQRLKKHGLNATLVEK